MFLSEHVPFGKKKAKKKAAVLGAVQTERSEVEPLLGELETVLKPL